MGTGTQVSGTWVLIRSFWDESFPWLPSPREPYVLLSHGSCWIAPPPCLLPGQETWKKQGKVCSTSSVAT